MKGQMRDHENKKIKIKILFSRNEVNREQA